jgi:hypothetical protein
VRQTYEIDLPRPRSLSIKREPHFLAYEDAIWRCIEDEVTAASKVGISSVGLAARG